jgi:hypothetical protein
MHTKFLSEYLKGGNDWDEISVGGRIILKLILKKEDLRILIGLICLRLGTSGGFL